MKDDLKRVFKFLDNLCWLPFSNHHRNFFQKCYFLYVHADLDIAFLQYSLVWSNKSYSGSRSSRAMLRHLCAVWFIVCVLQEQQLNNLNYRLWMRNNISSFVSKTFSGRDFNKKVHHFSTSLIFVLKKNATGNELRLTLPLFSSHN